MTRVCLLQGRQVEAKKAQSQDSMRGGRGGGGRGGTGGGGGGFGGGGGAGATGGGQRMSEYQGASDYGRGGADPYARFYAKMG